MKRIIQITLGIAIWCAASVAGWYFGFRTSDERVSKLTSDLYDHAVGDRQTVFVYMEETMPLGIGDPVFVIDAEGNYTQVGEVASIPASKRLTFGTVEPVKTGELLLYGTAPDLGDEASLSVHETPESMEWVLQTMLPPQKRRQVSLEIRNAFEQHQDEIVKALQPIIEEGFYDAIDIVERDFESALIARSGELERIGAKYQGDLVEREVIPLVRSEIFPIVRKHGEPLANQVGKEMWEEASVWRFGWRYIYDISPLPQRDLARKEWDRFLNKEAIPILESHVDDFVRMQQRVFTDVARNPRVQDVVRKSVRQIIRDPDVQELVMEIIKEVFVDNRNLRNALRKHWTSPRARNAFRLASRRFEPTAVKIGEMMFGSPEDGITPEFARVLRNQVLRKDRRWLVLHPGVHGGEVIYPSQLIIRVERGETASENPFAIEPRRMP